MSGAAVQHKGGLATRLSQALALAVVFAMVLGASLTAPQSDRALPTVTAIGFLLLGGTLLSELLGRAPVAVMRTTATTGRASFASTSQTLVTITNVA